MLIGPPFAAPDGVVVVPMVIAPGATVPTVFPAKILTIQDALFPEFCAPENRLIAPVDAPVPEKMLTAPEVLPLEVPEPKVTAPLTLLVAFPETILIIPVLRPEAAVPVLMVIAPDAPPPEAPPAPEVILMAPPVPVAPP